MPKRKPIIEIDLGDNGGKVVFRSLEDIEAWVQKEEQAWAWLGEAVRQDGNIGQIQGRMPPFWQQIRQLVAQARPHLETPNADAHLNALKNNITAYYRNIPTRALHSSSPKSEFVFEIKKTDPVLAAYILGFFIGVQIVQGVTKSLEGALEGFLFQKGVRKNVTAEKRALTKLRKEWQASLTEHETEIGEIQKQFDDKKEEIEKLCLKQQADFDQMVGKGKAELENIAQTYDQRLALQAPVQYWSDKKTAHHKLAKIYGIAAGAWLAGSGCLLALAIYKVLNNLKPDAHPALWQSLILVLSALVVLFVTRILVRITLSHLHLKEDAHERVTMAETYLSLLRHEGGPAKEDLELILKTLFRATSDGLVKDDALPSPVMEWLTRLK